MHVPLLPVFPPLGSGDQTLVPQACNESILATELSPTPKEKLKFSVYLSKEERHKSSKSEELH